MRKGDETRQASLTEAFEHATVVGWSGLSNGRAAGAGVGVRCAPVPVPLTGSVAGPDGASRKTVRVCVAVPMTTGGKTT